MKNDFINEYKDGFIGIFEFLDDPYHIALKDNAVPVIYPPLGYKVVLRRL